MHAIKDEFLRFKRLKTLKIGQNKLSWGDESNWQHGAQKFAELFENVSFIEALDVKDNSIKDVHFSHMIPSLVQMKNLKFLSLEKNQITDASFSKYLKALVDHYGNG